MYMCVCVQLSIVAARGGEDGSGKQRVKRKKSSKGCSAWCVALVVLVSTSLVGSAQAYGCKFDSDCNYQGCPVMMISFICSCRNKK